MITLNSFLSLTVPSKATPFFANKSNPPSAVRSGGPNIGKLVTDNVDGDGERSRTRVDLAGKEVGAVTILFVDTNKRRCFGAKILSCMIQPVFPWEQSG